MASQTQVLGTLPINRKEYSPTAIYYKDNVVMHNNCAWYCKVNGTVGVTPAEGNNWSLWSGVPVVQELGNSQNKVISQAGVKDYLFNITWNLGSTYDRGIASSPLSPVTGETYPYGGSNKTTEFISLKDKLIVVSKITSCSSSQGHALIAFYDENKEFLNEYSDYLLLNTAGGSKTFEKIILLDTFYPNASFVKVSYDYLKTGSDDKIMNQVRLVDKQLFLDKILRINTDFVTTQKIEVDASNFKSAGHFLIYNDEKHNWNTMVEYVKVPIEVLKNSILFIDKIVQVNAGSVWWAASDSEDNLIAFSNLINSATTAENLILRGFEELPENTAYVLIYRNSLYSSNWHIIHNAEEELFAAINVINQDVEELKEKSLAYKEKPIIEDGLGAFVKYKDDTLSYEKWGTGRYSAYETIEDSIVYRVSNLGIDNGMPYILTLALYDSDKNLLPQYNEVCNNAGGAYNNKLLEYTISKEKYPEASYFRLSYGGSASKNIKLEEITEVPISTLADAMNELKAKVLAEETPIYIMGDSIASQIGGTMFKNITKIDKHQCINISVGGETCLDTMAHRNFIPYIVEPFTIPSGKVPSEPINIYSSLYARTGIAEDGVTKTYWNGYSKGYDNVDDGYRMGEGINPWDSQGCTIAGVKGTLYFKRSSPNRTDNYFVRAEEGDAVVLDRPQLVIADNDAKKQDIYVVFMGTNGGWYPHDSYDSFEKSAEELIHLYKTIAREIGHDKYIFLGFYMTAFLDSVSGPERVRRWKYFESRMVEEFGKHYLSCRQYLREYGWKDAGYELGFRITDSGYTAYEADKQKDIQGIKDGRIPWCTVGGESGVHMTAKASACVANQVSKRLFELGITESAPQIDISTISDGVNLDINEPDYGN